MQQQQHTLALTLPSPKVPTFNGNPIDYYSFIQAFEQLIESKTASSSARLYYLVQYTSGDVQELMRSCLPMNPEEGYLEARRLLKSRYGRNYQIAAAYVERVTSYPPIKSEDGDSLQRFSVSLTSCKNALKQIGYLNKIENPDSLQKIIENLPFGLRQKWRDIADDITEVKQREISIDDITSFVEKRARACNHPIFGKISKELKNDKFVGKNTTPQRGSSFATKNDENSSGNKSKCPLCGDAHWLSQCDKFKNKPIEERFELVRSLRLCYNCLRPGHVATSCNKQSFCKIEECKFKHSTFLHSNPKKTEGDQSKPVPQKNGYVSLDEKQGESRNVISLPLLPVKVKAKGSNRTVETYAFLDSGSNTSFITESLLSELGAKGSETTLSLTTLEQERNALKSSVISLEVCGLDGETSVYLPVVFSVTKLPVSREDIPHQSDVDRWPHLQGVVLPEVDAKVGLLIGNDVPQALQPVEVRSGNPDEPYATRTILGWTVNGPLGRDGVQRSKANLIQATELDRNIKLLYNHEFDDVNDDIGMSCLDKQALGVLENTIQLKNGHYELALPWKNVSPVLPKNKHLAERRLKLLKKRLEKDGDLLQKYSAFMDDLLQKGYARRIPKEDREKHSNVMWYLPHHPVFHPQKPDKVRVVFDCAAECGGTSLNKELLQGPDLTNSLVGVLTRFREGPVAMMADIEAVFRQVRVRPENCDALRFLWWPGNDLSSEPEEYQMMVHLFGSVSSPTCANFALRRTADDNSKHFDPDTITTVKRNFCLKSSASEETAINTAEQLRLLLSRDGFRLTKWLSNSRKVVESIPDTERAKTVKEICLTELPTERALGVLWNVELDTFGFTIAIKDKPITRRGILSVVSSVYDPLGFAAPFILLAKEILQELCRMDIGWDDPIPEECSKRWRDWLEKLPMLEMLKIERSFKPTGFEGAVSAELHHFSDVDTKSNPAEDASRGLQAEDLIKSKRWLGGPEFLVKSKGYWPKPPDARVPGVKDNDPEVKRNTSFVVKTKVADVGNIHEIFARFSSWYRLKKFAAWMLRYRSALRKSCERRSSAESKPKPADIRAITVEELRVAEREIVKVIQRRSFVEEIEAVREEQLSNSTGKTASKSIKRCSSLYKLDPVFVNQVLCVGGRLRNSSVPKEARHPVILPKNDHVVTLIIEHCHNISGHSGLEYVLALLRERFGLIGARVAVKRALGRCFDCKRRHGPVGEQKMADLPEDRVTADKLPFSNVGIDCFGPFIVKRGRGHAKRHGVLFTCLAIKAVHIEVVQNLDTDSFLIALRRFVARRGQPEEIRSDNGTNFVGGDRELRTAIKAWNQERISEFLTQRNVKWLYNTPRASHHGGVWERCIRTVRKVLNALMKEQELDDERLTTLMYEVEAIVNNRPITKVSDDPKDLEALTPNHLLLLRKGSHLPPGAFKSSDLYSRRKWRQVQYLADIFWKRWVK